jgi:hypothetical protein
MLRFSQSIDRILYIKAHSTSKELAAFVRSSWPRDTGVGPNPEL